MNAYAITFYRETGDQAEDVDIRTVTVESAVDPEDLAAGDWDAHQHLTLVARNQGLLATFDGWHASHVTLPDGDVSEVPAGL